MNPRVESYLHLGIILCTIVVPPALWMRLDHHAALSLQCRTCASSADTWSALSIVALLVLASATWLNTLVSQFARSQPNADSPGQWLPRHARRRLAAHVGVVALVMALILGNWTRHTHRPAGSSWTSSGFPVEPATALMVDGRWELLTAWDENVLDRLEQLSPRATSESCVELRTSRSSWGPGTELLHTTRVAITVDPELPRRDRETLRALYLTKLETISYGGYAALADRLADGDAWSFRIIWRGLLMLSLLIGGCLLAASIMVLSLHRQRYLFRLAASWRGRARIRATGRCDQCGYDLRGLPRPVCPECGRNFADARLSFGAERQDDSTAAAASAPNAPDSPP